MWQKVGKELGGFLGQGEGDMGGASGIGGVQPLAACTISYPLLPGPAFL